MSESVPPPTKTSWRRTCKQATLGLWGAWPFASGSDIFCERTIAHMLLMQTYMMTVLPQTKQEDCVTFLFGVDGFTEFRAKRYYLGI